MGSEQTNADRTKLVRFALNGTPVEIDDVDPNLTILDYLRLQAGLTGSKEGCAEGDCGACVVALGSLDSDGQLQWQAVNSCIRFVSSLDSLAIMTVDGLNIGANDALHPVQATMVQHHASQCGFCTPGFVMSLFALYESMSTPRLTRGDIEVALSGNLCRCTGYRPIIDAALALERDTSKRFENVSEQLRKFQSRGNIQPPIAAPCGRRP